MKKYIVTESEGIEILIAAGLSNGEEREKAFYKRNGYINTGRALDAFLEKLKQVHSNAKLVIDPDNKQGRPFAGKKRLIELSEKRSELTERIDHRKTKSGRPTSTITTLMTNFIFKQLLNITDNGKKSVHMTMIKWYEFIGLYNLTHDEIRTFNNSLEEIYDSIKVKGMREYTVYEMNTRIYNVHRYSFQKLEKDEKIELSHVYKTVLSDETEELVKELSGSKSFDKVQIMSEKRLEEIQKVEEEKLKEFGIGFEEYEKARMFPKFVRKEVRNILPEMDELLKVEFGIKSYFRELEITVLDTTLRQDVSKKEARQAFIDRTVELHLKKCDKEEFVNGDTYSKKFFKLNLLILLQSKGAEGLGQIIDKELFTLQFRINEVKEGFRKLQEKEEDSTNNGDELLKDVEAQTSVVDMLPFGIVEASEPFEQKDYSINALADMFKSEHVEEVKCNVRRYSKSFTSIKKHHREMIDIAAI